MFESAFRHFVTALLLLGGHLAQDMRPGWHWSWVCKAGKCVKTETPHSSSTEAVGTTQNICKLTCGKYGALWPRPTGGALLGHQVIAFHPSRVKFDYSEVTNSRSAKDYMQRISKIFQSNLLKDCGVDCDLVPDTDVTIYFAVTSSDLRLNWDTDESYSLDVTTGGAKVVAKLRAKTVYGARHGLETLNQLVTWYSATATRATRHVLVIVSTARISDSPMFPHRGLLLDTARNFLSMSTILRMIDGMAMSKLNVLHWHVTDSQSFPLETPRVPQLTRYGAYSFEQVYSVHDTAHILEYARLRGIRVIIEIDAPAHAGNGWQWGEAAGLGKLAVCVNQQPWRNYCIQPPCGQLNPANPNLYSVLRDVYRDVIDLTPPGEAFHMGGDEVFFPCWNSSEEIVAWMKEKGYGVTTADFLQLWADYQATVLQIYDEVNPIPKTPVILWSSHLTDPDVIEKFLDKERYVIETWVEASNSMPATLLSKGYKLIMATKDTWYLDHGFWGSTVYHNWRVAYDNKLPKHENVLGGEAAMWGELVDDQSIDVKVWPRTAAVAERLWSNPDTNSLTAEPRMQQFRQRLIKRGTRADSLSPLYCYQNEADCY